MTKQELIQKHKDLLAEYNEQKQNSPLKGNPFIVALHARAQGIGEALPLIDSLSEQKTKLLELVKELRYFLDWGPENSSHRSFDEIDSLIKECE